MEAYAQVLNYAIPVFLLLILTEWAAGCFMHIRTNRIMDTISSLSSGMTNTLKDVLGLTIIIVSYQWMYQHLALLDIQSEVWMYVLAFIGLDFAGYWSHRFSHVINIFWNRHIIHHSSEEFNLACALRQSVSEVFAVFFFLYIPMAIIGIPPKVIAVVAPLHLFAQFWYHTRLIGKMGFLEHIIVTPSHHRVHHAINPEYIDKNYSQIFIIWDKLFGTFQEELPDVPPVYGITRPARTWNPIIINFQHFWLLLKDAWRTRSWWDKLRIWFMPTGWRPADVAEKYPVFGVKNPYELEKYDVDASLGLKIWSAAQLVIHLLLMLYLFNHLGQISHTWVLLYGVWLFVSIFAFTSLMDGSIWALPAEITKAAAAVVFLHLHDYSWFGIEQWWGAANHLMWVYIVLSLLLCIWFLFVRKPEVVLLKEDLKQNWAIY